MGDFAPVVIRAGAMCNTRDLLLSPEHRLFIGQHRDAIGVGRFEVPVKVRHLIDGDTVYQQDGGFVAYVQLLFDDHHILYAEGIAAETLLVDSHPRAALPRELAMRLGRVPPDHAAPAHLSDEVQESEVRSRDTLRRLRPAASAQ